MPIAPGIAESSDDDEDGNGAADGAQRVEKGREVSFEPRLGR